MKSKENTTEKEIMDNSIKLIKDSLFFILSNTNEKFGDSIENLVNANTQFRESFTHVQYLINGLIENKKQLIKDIKLLEENKKTISVFNIERNNLLNDIENIKVNIEELKTNQQTETLKLQELKTEKERAINEYTKKLELISNDIKEKLSIVLPKEKDISDREKKVIRKEKDLNIIEMRLKKIYKDRGIPLKVK